MVTGFREFGPDDVSDDVLASRNLIGAAADHERSIELKAEIVEIIASSENSGNLIESLQETVLGRIALSRMYPGIAVHNFIRRSKAERLESKLVKIAQIGNESLAAQ